MPLIYASTPWSARTVSRKHEANPVLVAYREYDRPIPVELFIKGWWYPDVVKGWSGAKFSQRAHARRVFARWLAIFGPRS